MTNYVTKEGNVRVVVLLEGGSHVSVYWPTVKIAAGWIKDWADWLQAGQPNEPRYRVIAGDSENEGMYLWAAKFDKIIAMYVSRNELTAADRAADAMEKLTKVPSDEWKDDE